MATQIIITGAVNGGVMSSMTVVFWYPVTVGAKAVAGVSAWASASAAENTAIQNGSIIEEVQTFQFPSGLSAANVEAFLNQYFTNRNAQINNIGPGLFANIGYNGIAWIANIT